MGSGAGALGGVDKELRVRKLWFGNTMALASLQ